jgi:hypothetical protein
MKITALAISLTMVFVSAALAADDPPGPIDGLIDQSGLGHLSEEDREKLRALISAVANADQKQARLAELATKYFTAQGYKLIYLQLAEVDGTYWLVVHDTFRKSATSDLPLMFPRASFKDGYYFCKTGIVGGIKAMLDENGTEQRFLFANWKDLR